MVLSIHKNSQIPILSGIDRLSYITILLVLIKIQWEIENIVLIDHHVISYLISILIFLEIFLITLSFNINDMQPDIIIFLLSALKDFYFIHGNFLR